MIEKITQATDDDRQKTLLMALTVQKETVDKAYENLLASPTLENVQTYRAFIKEFLTLLTAQMYVVGAKSNWKSVPCTDIYSKSSAIENCLDALQCCVDNAANGSCTDNTILKMHCETLNSYIAEFFKDVYDGAAK